MTLSLRHAFNSPVPDESDPNEVGPNEWNAEHNLLQDSSRILGRVTVGDGPTEELTPAQVRTLLNVAEGATAVTVSDAAYDATSWNGNTDVPTKNAVRDKFESLSGGGFFHDTFENVTTDNTTPIEFDPEVFLSIVTSDGSDLEQTIQCPALTNDDAGRLHLIVFRTMTSGSDVIRVSGTAPAEFLMTVDGDLHYVLLRFSGGAGWVVLVGGGAFDDDPSGYPRVASSGTDGGINFLGATEYTTWPRLQESVTIVGGAANTDPAFYATSLTTDGSGGAQTINISNADLPSKYGIDHVIYVSSRADPGDVATITASDGIIGGEVLTVGPAGSWVLMRLVVGGWLPLSFGGGATTDAVGNRTLQFADTGALTWV